MTMGQQKMFIHQLCNNVRDDMIKMLLAVDPAEIALWDGHELRMWIAKQFLVQSEVSDIARHPQSVRARDYRNTVLVNNL